MFTGEDTNCAFKGKGKINPFKKLQTLQSYQARFKNLGKSYEISDRDMKKLEEFVCVMYGFPRVKFVDTARLIKREHGEGQIR